MALTDFAAFFAWAGAALVVYTGAAVGIGRGWVRAGGRLQATGMLFVVLLAQRATLTKGRRSRGHGATGVEASARTLKDEAYFWLPVIAVCVLGLFVNASVKAMRRRRQRERERERERMPEPVQGGGHGV